MIVLSAQSVIATTVPTQPTQMSREQLVALFQKELGDKFDPAQTDALLSAHQMLEDFFDKPTERKQITAAIEATNIDPNILGKLARVRATWQPFEPGSYYINERVGPFMVKYFVGVPKNYDPAKSWPLLIKLPASDQFARTPKPTADEVTVAYQHWIDDEIAAHPDQLVIMPLLNLDEFYGPSYAGMHTVIQPMYHASERFNIDPSRVYMLGHSMSAHATWNIALMYPTYFAAFAPLAGGASAEYQRVRIIALRNVLPVVWHDSDDKVIAVDAARRIVNALKAQKVEVSFDQTKGIGHVPLDSVIERVYSKLKNRARDLYPKRVSLQSNRPDTIFNRNDWLQIYQPMNAGDEHRLIFSKGRGFMVTYANTFKADATIAKNKIEVTADNVAFLRLYFNDQMIDFSQPVTVSVNRKVRFEGKLTPSADVMLKDQLFLGRGWRYYTAFVDLDLAATTRPATRPATTRATTRPTTTRPAANRP
ncbi:MAG: hypothetical protein H7X80_11490 [bacterium]|nr:hypothetical protein [Candidatus Kapabacteria bacterium]